MLFVPCPPYIDHFIIISQIWLRSFKEVAEMVSIFSPFV